jgi:hypothetical protein
MKLFTTLAAIAATLSPLLAQSIVPERAEPNDPAAGTPTPISCGDQGQGAIDVAGDDDGWAFTLTARSTVQLTVTPGWAPPRIGDSRVEVLDAGTLARLGFDDDGGDGLHPLLTVVLDPGNYVAVVDGFSSNVGTYTFDVVCYAAPPASICTSRNPISEGAEPNDTVGTATSIACCDLATGDISVAGDDDWYALILSQQTRVILTTAPGPVAPVGDTRIEVFDAAGTTSLAFDDDGGPSYYSLIDITLDAGLYHINVDGYGARIGDYLLFVDCMPGVTLTSATYQVTGTGCTNTANRTITISQRANERPFVGSVFCVEVGGLPSSSAWGILGFIDQMPPVDLGIIGMPTCLQYTDVVMIMPLTVPPGSAYTEWCLRIPVVPGLAGIGFNQQIFALDPGANAFGAVTSAVGEGVFGERF